MMSKLRQTKQKVIAILDEGGRVNRGVDCGWLEDEGVEGHQRC